MSQYQSFPGAAGDSRTLDKLKALRMPELGGKAFLDVGCNEGFFCGFAHAQGAIRVVGIDHSLSFIQRARARFPGCEFLHQGWERLPDGMFDVILLASALHYAEDQEALIHRLVERLSPDGTLVLELGIVSSARPEWTQVRRGDDERLFPSMPMLRRVLEGYAWKWMGPSISQDGDPVSRHVIHISRRRPMAYLLMQPPGYGKSSIAKSLFVPAGVPVISGDQKISRIGRGIEDAPEAMRALVTTDWSPFQIDRITRDIFDNGLGPQLVGRWLDGVDGGDVALDVYVPAEHGETVERILVEHGYMPVRLTWERAVDPPLPDDVLAQRAEQFYLSLLGGESSDGDGAPRRVFDPLGFVDEITIEDDRLLVRGWAIDTEGFLPSEISVKLGRRNLRVDSVEKQLRPDAQRHLGLPHALVGYQLVLPATDIRSVADLKNFSVQGPDGTNFNLSGQIEAIVRGLPPR